MGEEKKASVYDVAQRAGISIATVSRALNQPHRLSAETREKVLAAIAELNYVPDGEASARARSSHTRIAVVSPLHTYPGFPARLRGIILALEALEAEVIVFNVDVMKLRERQQFKYFDSLAASGRYDAMIIMSLPLQSQYLDRIDRTGFPTVLIETEDDRFPSIQVDHQYGAELATEHLIEKGYESIGFLGFKNIQNYALDASVLREKGFRSAMAKRGKEIDESYIYVSGYGIDAANDVTRTMWKKGDHPRAIFCASDLNALGVLKTAKELKLRVPEDIAIVGFDDIDMASYMDLSTIKQPMEDTGRVAAELVINLLKKNQVTTRKVLLDLSLVSRKTS